MGEVDLNELVFLLKMHWFISNFLLFFQMFIAYLHFIISGKIEALFDQSIKAIQ